MASLVTDFESLWHTIEITPYEPLILREARQRLPEVPTDLLFPARVG